jgi:hypothetical protein
MVSRLQVVALSALLLVAGCGTSDTTYINTSNAGTQPANTPQDHAAPTGDVKLAISASTKSTSAWRASAARWS